MKLNKDNSKQFRNSTTPYLSNIIISNSGLIPNKVAYRKLPSNQTNQQKIDRGSITLANLSRGKSGNAPSKAIFENIRYNQTPSIKEDSQKTTKIIKKIVRTEQPKTQTHVEKKIVRTSISTSNNNSNINNINKNTNNIKSIINNSNINISNYNTNNDPILKNNNSYNSLLRGSYKEIYKNFTPPKTDSNNDNNNKSIKNSMRYSYSTNNKDLNTHIYKNSISINNSSYTNNYLNKKARYSTMVPSLSPGINALTRRTINRGDPIENVQITHIIYSSQPAKFNITEELNTESLNTEPIKITKIERKNLQKRGKTTWTSSVQDNVKPIITNLKGRTTIYQHARGIGMTNDKKENINPLFYSSEIRKLYPIIKEKQKEKVEYMSFRNESGFLSERMTYNRNINYGNQNYNFIKINNNNDNNKNNYERKSMNYNRGIIKKNLNEINKNNKSEIVSENSSRILMGNRSQYRKQGKPVINTNNERKLYNSNLFYRK